MIIFLILIGIIMFVFLCMLKSASADEEIQEKVKYDVNHKK